MQPNDSARGISNVLKRTPRYDPKFRFWYGMLRGRKIGADNDSEKIQLLVFLAYDSQVCISISKTQSNSSF